MNAIQCDVCRALRQLAPGQQDSPHPWILVKTQSYRLHFCGPRCVKEWAAKFMEPVPAPAQPMGQPAPSGCKL